GAAAGFAVEELAVDVRLVDFARILVLELHEAAAPAAVAERLPLLGGHFLERFFFPEGHGAGAAVKRGMAIGLHSTAGRLNHHPSGPRSPQLVRSALPFTIHHSPFTLY